MPSAAEQVDSIFGKANQFADLAKVNLSSYLGALNNVNKLTVKTDVKWAAPGGFPALPQKPTRPSTISAERFSFREPSSKPVALTEALPNAPLQTVIPDLRVIDVPEPPKPLYPPDLPSIPEVGAVQIPQAPEVPVVQMPSMLSLNVISAPIINLREDWLRRLEDVPTLDILQPTPYSYARGEDYASELLDGLKATLSARLAGGTGLSATVEQAIWDRARGREVAASRGAESEVMRNSEALGYALPAGVTVHQLAQAQQATATRLAELSRDIGIKQADLEQSNLRDAIAAGMQLEAKLIDYSSQQEQLSFTASRAAAEMGIQAYNAQMQQFQSLLQAYQAYAAGYKTIIEGELAKVDVFKARLEGERSKAEVNRALVEQYKASVEAGMSRVEIYRAQVGGAQAKIELEKAKISAAAERVKGYVAQVNIEVSKLEGYKAQVAGISSVQAAESARISAFATRAQAEGDVARTHIQRYEALARSKAAEWDGYRAQVQAEAARISALGAQASANVEEYKVGASMYTAQAQVEMSRWEGALTAYKQGQDHISREKEINFAQVRWAEGARQDAAKVGAQVYAQLTASAYGMLNANASISGSSALNYNLSALPGS